MSQIVNGWSFPDDVTVPDEGWTRVKNGGGEFYVIGHDILIDIAHQAGLNGIETEVVHAGHGMNDVPYVAVKATVDIEGRPLCPSIGSIDETDNSLSDMVSTAETRAVKRSIKRAMGITNPGSGAEDPDAAQETSTASSTTKTRQGGEISRDEEGNVEVTPPDDSVPSTTEEDFGL